MPKFAATLFVIYSLLVLSLAVPAQPQAKPDDATVAEMTKGAPPAASTAEPKPAKKTVDLKKALEEETRKLTEESTRFDPVKIELEKAKQARKKGWGKTETTILVAFAVGIAVLVFLVAKYGKECVETTPRGCSLNLDENCYCERYREDNNAGRAAPR